jgi:hypothetical protein
MLAVPTPCVIIPLRAASAATTFASSLANPEEAVRTAALNEAHSGTLNRNWAGSSRQGAQLEPARVALGRYAAPLAESLSPCGCACVLGAVGVDSARNATQAC